MTEAMLTEEMQQGVDVIAATPHFYADQMSVDGFLERRAAALEKTENIRRNAEKALPRIVTGAEVYYFRGMGRAKDIPRLCIEDTNTLLLEMPFEQWDKEVLQDVRDLISKQKLSIVLAHIERYVDFQKNKEIWDQILSLPVRLQINAGSLLRKGSLLHPDRRKRFCLRLLSENPYVILGSDCHNMTSRPPNIAAARDFLSTRVGDGILDCIDSTTRRVLEPQ